MWVGVQTHAIRYVSHRSHSSQSIYYLEPTAYTRIVFSLQCGVRLVVAITSNCRMPLLLVGAELTLCSSEGRDVDILANRGLATTVTQELLTRGLRLRLILYSPS